MYEHLKQKLYASFFHKQIWIVLTFHTKKRMNISNREKWVFLLVSYAYDAFLN